MAKNTMNESFTFSYRSSENNTGDTVADVNISFDNPKDDSVIVARINSWLTAIGRENIEAKTKASK